jgi:hypothetical protein
VVLDILQAGAAVASRFVADTPTITMSRLKALLTVSAAAPFLYCLASQQLLPENKDSIPLHHQAATFRLTVQQIHTNTHIENLAGAHCLAGGSANIPGCGAELLSLSHHRGQPAAAAAHS